MNDEAMARYVKKQFDFATTYGCSGEELVRRLNATNTQDLPKHRPLDQQSLDGLMRAMGVPENLLRDSTVFSALGVSLHHLDEFQRYLKKRFDSHAAIIMFRKCWGAERPVVKRVRRARGRIIRRLRRAHCVPVQAGWR